MLMSGILLSTCTKDNKVLLFNGKDLINWDKVVFEEADVDEVFQVGDGIIQVSGVPNGYIITRDSYSNYKLHVEWRWATEPTNSGVLLHVQETNLEEWPLCIEAQLMNSNAGDIVMIGHGAGISVGDSTYIIKPEESRFKIANKFEESSESPAGEWNTYEITCDGDNIELIVNGILQNKGTLATLRSGPIALQSEGSPIEFRNVYLIPLE
ncbi:MAG: hypothetical protein AMS23_06090 [Bacteroides sp. SM1_62]|nr:MAG: hypothetical protein AMS26_07015 [Bacteroides sp. SM23_62]KPL23960.1 MAG: hypothetical protein AMS23_06090 [Bacteroides sp. SM1_62]